LHETGEQKACAQKLVEAGFEYLTEIDGVKPSEKENEQIDNCSILYLHMLS